MWQYYISDISITSNYYSKKFSERLMEFVCKQNHSCVLLCLLCCFVSVFSGESAYPAASGESAR